jgi:hypothetical protein
MNLKASLYLFISLSLFGCKSIEKESESIKRLLEKESSTYRSGDSKAHASCWQIQPYSRILVSSVDGKTMDIPPAMMVKISEDNIGPGGSSSNSNYKISILKNSAWVSHDEISIAKDGKKTYSYEIRILEKIKNEWKLVGQSIHAYKTE